MANPGSVILPSLILSFTSPPKSPDTDHDTSSDSSPDEEPATDRLLFDFQKFLQGGALDDVFEAPTDPTGTPTPSVTAPDDRRWEVTKLSGGWINITVRAFPRREDDKLGKDPKSVVIKYAPPFVARIGESVPFGTFRQVIEYRALSLLGSTPSVKFAEAAYKVATPRVLKFFEDQRLLVLEDLGEWMKPIDSWMYPAFVSSPEHPPSMEACISVGTRLGNIIASIHCDRALVLEAQALTDSGRPWFENPDTNGFVREQIVDKILPILQPRINPGADRTEKIVEIVYQDFECGFLETLHPSSSPSFDVARLMFSMGDLWTGSIIAGASPGSDAATEVEVGLIDWEFASLARIGQDTAQLSAWLYLFATSSAWCSTEPCSRRGVTDTLLLPGQFGTGSGSGANRGEGGGKPVTVETLGWRSPAAVLMDALLKAYAGKVKDYPDYAWLVDEGYDGRRYEKERFAAIRSIWVLFGREVIFNSVDAATRLADFFTMDGREEEVKVWQKEMIEVGCWYVSVAGESSDEEFEDLVRRERMLKRMYTVSGSL